jgi:hypothetical protein
MAQLQVKEYVLPKTRIHEKDITVIKHPDDGGMDSRIFYLPACICHTYTAGSIHFIVYPFTFINRRNSDTKIFPGKKPEKQLI